MKNGSRTRKTDRKKKNGHADAGACGLCGVSYSIDADGFVREDLLVCCGPKRKPSK